MIYRGLELPDEDDAGVALGAIILIKMISADGELKYREYKTPELHPVEALGMADTFVDTIRRAIMRGARGIG